MINRELKYFCLKCKTVRESFIAIIFEIPGDNSSRKEIEVIKTFNTTFKDNETGKELKREFKARKLVCGHYINFHELGFRDNSDSLSEIEARDLRSVIDNNMLGKNAKEIEQAILFHCEEYQTLLKISTKQMKQAKYVIQYLDQLRKRYVEQLSDEKDKENFDLKFAHFLELRPTTEKVIKREKTKIDKEVDQQKLALDKVREMLAKSGYKMKDLLGQ